MGNAGTDLHFPRTPEEAFIFYKYVLGGAFGRSGIARFKDIPPSNHAQPISEKEQDLVTHVELPILGGH